MIFMEAIMIFIAYVDVYHSDTWSICRNVYKNRFIEQTKTWLHALIVLASHYD